MFQLAKQMDKYWALQGLELLAMAAAAIMGAVFSLLLSFASVNLKADQTIGGTALNLMAPAIVLFFIRIIANQNTMTMSSGDSASWFMIKKTTLGYDRTADLGFLGNTFLDKVYLATYICILLFVILSIILYKTRFGLRLRACGENPQAADSLGINVYKTVSYTHLDVYKRQTSSSARRLRSSASCRRGRRAKRLRRSLRSTASRWTSTRRWRTSQSACSSASRYSRCCTGTMRY